MSSQLRFWAQVFTQVRRLSSLRSGPSRIAAMFLMLPLLVGVIENAAAGLSDGEVRLGPSIIDVLQVELDSHHSVHTLFALLHYSIGGDQVYQMLYSLDGGVSWQYSPGAQFIGADVSMAVIRDFCYVTYIAPGGQQIYADRYFVSNGQFDSAYAHYLVKDAGGANIYREIALTSSTDQTDDSIYCFVLADNGAIFWFTADQDGGAGLPGWTAQPTVESNAVQGLDAAYSNTGWRAFASYLSESGDGDAAPDQVSVMRADPLGPDIRVVGSDPWDAALSTTRVSAYLDEAVVVYQAFDGDYLGVRFKITYNAWDGWYQGWVARPDGAQVAYRSPDVTLRRGHGIAVSYIERNSANLWGDVVFKHRPYGQGSSWSTPHRFAVRQGSVVLPTAIEQMPVVDDLLFGVAFITGEETGVTDAGEVYFDLPLLIFNDGFESGDDGDWSSATE